MNLAALEAGLRETALGYPEAEEHFPWNERVIKVRGKIFLFLGMWKEGLLVGMKLPASHEMALMFEPCTPMRYNLGKSGWISCHLFADSDFDSDILPGWIAESYRAVAPKALVKLLNS